MTIKTSKVTGRRNVHYENLDALMSDAETLASGQCETLGNWTYPQILEHLTLSLTGALDGFGFRGPLLVRLMSRLIFKKRFLSKPLPSGFKIPKPLPQPDDVSLETALTHLRTVVERTKETSNRAEHPFLGRLTREESDKLQLRHAELHMSFVLPSSDQKSTD